MVGVGSFWWVVGKRCNRVAMLGAALLVAACGSGPTATAPQANATPTVPPTPAALGNSPVVSALNGLAPAQVAALMGNPDLRRVDPPAEVWQYRSADCVLELYFYDSGSSTRVVYAETRSRAPRPGPDATSCRERFGPPTAPTRQTKL
ncbi:MAG TPA: hypothetical protein VEU53_07935 [Stellaceae bacterium]|nr:hypothetical protein [Stellaceae bacterium]